MTLKAAAGEGLGKEILRHFATARANHILQVVRDERLLDRKAGTMCLNDIKCLPCHRFSYQITELFRGLKAPVIFINFRFVMKRCDGFVLHNECSSFNSPESSGETRIHHPIQDYREGKPQREDFFEGGV